MKAKDVEDQVPSGKATTKQNDAVSLIQKLNVQPIKRLGSIKPENKNYQNDTISLCNETHWIKLVTQFVIRDQKMEMLCLFKMWNLVKYKRKRLRHQSMPPQT